MTGLFRCPCCDQSRNLIIKEPKLLRPTNVIEKCHCCETVFRLTFILKKGEILKEIFPLELTPIAIDLILEEPERIRQILTPLVARCFLTRVEITGERIGFLVNGKTGVETKLSDASDAQLLSSAKAVLELLKNQSESASKNQITQKALSELKMER